MATTDDPTSTSAAQYTITNGVLSLLPPKDGPVYQCLRLGMTFDHADTTGETWTDYTAGLQGSFTSRDADTVTLTDMDTHTEAQLSLSILAKVEQVQTWRTHVGD